MKETDIAWLAGLLEGEGWFTYANGAPRIGVGMADRDVIDRAANLMYTKVFEKRSFRGHRTQWTTTLYGVPALNLMRSLLPHMCKRRAAKIKEILEKTEDKINYKGKLSHGTILRAEHLPLLVYLHKDKEISVLELARISGLSRTTIARALVWETAH